MLNEEYLNKLGPLLLEQKSILKEIGKNHATEDQIERLEKNIAAKCSLLARYNESNLSWIKE